MAATRASPLCSTPSGTLLPLSPPAMALASAMMSASEALEQNPPDLVCPITHEIFTEPVINGAGQVYERAAIEMHMRRSTIDPVTRMHLHPSSGLTPVWIVKSRSVRVSAPHISRAKRKRLPNLRATLLLVQSTRIQGKDCTAMRPASIPQSWSRCRQVSEESSGTVRRCQICNSGDPPWPMPDMALACIVSSDAPTQLAPVAAGPIQKLRTICPDTSK